MDGIGREKAKVMAMALKCKGSGSEVLVSFLCLVEFCTSYRVTSISFCETPWRESCCG